MDTYLQPLVLCRLFKAIVSQKKNDFWEIDKIEII